MSRYRAPFTLATSVVVISIGVAACSSGTGSETQSNETTGVSAASPPTLSGHSGRLRNYDGLLPPVLVCSTAPGFLGTGIDVLNVSFEAFPVSWDGSDFENSLQSDLDAGAQTPWYFQPNGLDYSWVAFPLPTSYPQSVTDLVNAYSNVSPIDSQIFNCTSVDLLDFGDGGGLLDLSTGSYVVWDPGGGGIGE